jgi:uncharacterized protein YbjQ (UPF0145 family)
MPDVSDDLQTAKEQLDQLTEAVDPSLLSTWQFKAFVALVALLAALLIYRRVRRAIRRRRPVRLHPKLQKYGQAYGEPDEAFLAKRRAEAEKIIATSSTPTIAGYEIIEQVEAVYMDGLRKPEDALEGLKAVAAMKGANAVANVQHSRGSDGKYVASGDAVIVRKAGTPQADNVKPAPPPGPGADSAPPSEDADRPGDTGHIKGTS